ncbi:hypothetical protein PIROE2DRAFT_18620 [Piromyces sp. E2]|nr:hypothetical protein PIROE2DRAFT_18620 [Piromyces sp. E2]|eukprot:OUM56659.1 hypothetical protein PIROE2DRAFT_18620 [Piromyces sp. E2]
MKCICPTACSEKNCACLTDCPCKEECEFCINVNYDCGCTDVHCKCRDDNGKCGCSPNDDCHECIGECKCCTCQTKKIKEEEEE